MEYPKIKSIDDLPVILGILPTSLKRWFKNYPFGNHSDCHKIKNKLLAGKPVIAAFMGISEKTLKRWFVKYPTLPIERTQYRCYALTNNLMLWKVYRELEKIPESRIAAAYDRVVTNLATFYGVGKKFYLDYYVRRYNPEHPFLRARAFRTRHYRNTVDKAVKLLWLSRSLLNPPVVNKGLEKLYLLSPPELFMQSKNIANIDG
jgi:hypothetical protein